MEKLHMLVKNMVFGKKFRIIDDHVENEYSKDSQVTKNQFLDEDYECSEDDTKESYSNNSKIATNHRNDLNFYEDSSDTDKYFTDSENEDENENFTQNQYLNRKRLFSTPLNYNKIQISKNKDLAVNGILKQNANFVQKSALKLEKKTKSVIFNLEKNQVNG